MSCDQNYPFPQVFLVDRGGSVENSAQPPSLVPCWSFPPAQQRVRRHERSRGCMGVSPSASLVVLMLFLLVFAGMGFEAYKIYGLQKELKGLKEVNSVTEFHAPQKQIGLYQPPLKGEDDEERPAAHVLGRIERENSLKVSNTLRWDPHVGRAYISGGVVYQYEDGALQVNQTGIYHIYSRVELIFKDCSPSSSFVHVVFVRRKGRIAPLTLMEAHRAGFCSQQMWHSWTTESYLASTLQLKENDRVFVNVSHPTYLSHRHYSNFFGLYKI